MTTNRKHVCLWIDGVGGFALCNAVRFKFGSATMNADADATVFADIPRFAFAIETFDESTVIYPGEAEITVNGNQVASSNILHSHDTIEVQRSVRLLYRRPNPLSATSCLTLTSRHRFNHHVDSVILMSHCCVIGNTSHAHIENRNSSNQWMLTREDEADLQTQWFISKRESLTQVSSVVSKSSSVCQKRSVLQPMERFQDDGLQLTLRYESREI